MGNGDMGLPTALVVIDVQNGLIDATDPGLPFRRDEVLANINTLLSSARTAGADVLFVRHEEPDYEQMTPGHFDFEVHADIAPLEGETIIDKLACDAFCNTSLEDVLREYGAGHIVTCGMQTEYCVDSGTRSAMHRGLNVTLASDAHTTWDNGVLTAAQIIAHTNQTLAGLPGPGTGIKAMPAAEIRFGARPS